MSTTNKSGGIISKVFSLLLLAAILYGIYYAFGGNPEAFATSAVNFGEGVWDFITRMVRTGIDAGRDG